MRIRTILAVIILVLMVTISANVINCYAGEKEELLGQKKYIEQKLSGTELEFQGIMKAYQLQVQTFQNDLRGITQRLQQIEQEEVKKKEPKAEPKK